MLHSGYLITKTMRKPFFLLIVLVLLSCQKDHLNDPTVKQFVTMLKAGNYDSSFLPDFRPDDIERLLYYANDFQKIENFPVNPISSFMPPEFRLGECLMWTIESIRLHYDETDSFRKFPSLVPQLVIPGGTMAPQIASVDDLDRAYNLYLAWWTNNKNKNFDDFRSINPLKDAVLMWR